MATKTKATNDPIRFKFLNETKGAVRYQEVDKEGADSPADKARIGSLYFRKSQFGKVSETGFPPFLVITVQVE